MKKNKKKNRVRKVTSYERLFVKDSPITARKGKMVYIRREFHETILNICHVIGDKEVSISGYIDNVLANHFTTYGAEITRIYDEKHKGITIYNLLEK